MSIIFCNIKDARFFKKWSVTVVCTTTSQSFLTVNQIGHILSLICCDINKCDKCNRNWYLKSWSQQNRDHNYNLKPCTHIKKIKSYSYRKGRISVLQKPMSPLIIYWVKGCSHNLDEHLVFLDVWYRYVRFKFENLFCVPIFRLNPSFYV